jgi:hypothetical protein
VGVRGLRDCASSLHLPLTFLNHPQIELFTTPFGTEFASTIAMATPVLKPDPAACHMIQEEFCPELTVLGPVSSRIKLAGLRKTALVAAIAYRNLWLDTRSVSALSRWFSACFWWRGGWKRAAVFRNRRFLCSHAASASSYRYFVVTPGTFVAAPVRNACNRQGYMRFRGDCCC